MSLHREMGEVSGTALKAMKEWSEEIQKNQVGWRKESKTNLDEEGLRMRDEAFADLDTLGKETIKSYSEMNADLDSEIAEIVGVSPAEGNPGDTLSMLASYAQTEVTTVNNYIETSRELIEKLIKEKEEAMGDAANFVPVYDAQEAYAA